MFYVYKMANTKEEVTSCKISPDHLSKINSLIPERFASVDEFVHRAIDVMVSWELNPPVGNQKFTERDPTIKQFAFMNTIMQEKQLAELYPNFPQAFGDGVWDKYLEEHPEINKVPEKVEQASISQRDARRKLHDLEELISKIDDAFTFVKEKDFENNLGVKGDEIKYDGWPLLYTHYSRIFPAKIGLFALGELMRQTKSTMINFEEFTKKAYDIAEEISQKQITRETMNKKLKRASKISIGLPKPYNLDDITPEQAIKEQRYKDKIFGKVRKSKEGLVHFEGLMAALDIIKIFQTKDEIQITFSKKGKEWYMMDNPVFRGVGDSTTFSDNEKEFAIEHLIKDRELETLLIEKSKNLIKNSDVISDEIGRLDEVFYDEIKNFAKSSPDSKFNDRLNSMIRNTDEINANNKSIEEEIKNNDGVTEINSLKDNIKQTPVQAVRIATLGRMTELSIINWDSIGKKSIYTIAD